MITAESRRGRRIVGTLARGADLHEALQAICREHRVRSGEFRGIGALESAELCAYDQSRQRWSPPRLLGSGGLELLQLCGNISEQEGKTSVRAQATLMRERDAGIEVLGGHLVRARVFAVEVVIESFDDLVLRTARDAVTGMPLWKEAVATPAEPVAKRAAAEPEPVAEPEPEPVPAEPEPVPEPVPVAVAEPAPEPERAEQRPARPAPLPDWQAKAPLARDFVEPDEDEQTLFDDADDLDNPIAPAPVDIQDALAFSPPPRRASLGHGATSIPALEAGLAAGDVIVHPKFHRCVVERVEMGGEFAQVRLRNGRVIRLSLDVIELTPQTPENGQRVFSATID